jgi:2-(1,2-epoxy-1,2-dihydrophenyl)acetyl-CoA isomerase
MPVVAREAGVLHLTLDRPEKLNAIDYAVVAFLQEQLELAASDPDVRCVLLDGQGRAFCAGDDLAGMGEPPIPIPDGDNPTRHLQQRLMRQWYWLEKPTIVAVQGRCHGIAHDLALAADFRVVANDARFGDLRARRAIPVGSGATYLLARAVGLAAATRILLTGEEVPAVELDRLGVTCELVEPDDLRDAAAARARQLAEGPTKAFGILKRELRTNLGARSLDEALELELSLLDEPVEDTQEGFRAFAEHRPPRFTGR